MKKTLHLFILLIATLFFSSNCFAMINESDESYLKKVETYVNSLQKISGKFTQHSSNGAKDSGKFYINKPGKMRLQYNSPILLVADGTSIVYEDKKTNQISYISMNSNPASIVLNGNITFTGKNPSVKIKSIEERQDTTEITLTTANEKQSGVITLIFENKPLSFSGWRVRDAQGIVTEVTLSDIKPETYFDPSLFKITRNKTIGTTKSKSKYY